MTLDEIHKLLRDDLVRANEASRIASDELSAILNDSPSGLPHPDGTQRIRNASIACAAARTRVAAMRRHHDFIMNGTVPEDLRD